MKRINKRQLHANETRRAIISSALTLFSAQGFNQTSIDAIATHAKVTKGAVYHHFGTKRDVFEACFEYQVEKVSQAVVQKDDDGDDWQAMFNQSQAFLNYVHDKNSNTLPIQEVISVLGWEQWERINSRFVMRHIRDIVIRLQKNGEMKPHPTEMLVGIIYGLLVGATMTLRHSPNNSQARQEVNSVVKDMFLGLKAT